MKQYLNITNRRQRGAAIVGVLFFILIISVLLMGTGTYAVSHQTRASADANYAAAMDLAEAGINFELRKITSSGASADQYPGSTYSLGPGTFKVYCTNKDGGVPWSPPNNLYVISTGLVSGATRTVKVSIKGNMVSGDYSVFAIKQATLSDDPSQFNGNIGTNGTINVSAGPKIVGSISLNGPTATMTGGAGKYTVVNNSQPLLWPTVDEIANAGYPTNGLGVNYFSSHNDNASVGLGTTLSSAKTLTTGNYYFTSISLSSGKLTFDNRGGPINIWVGPSGGAGNVDLSGGLAAVALSSTPNVHIYVATKGTVHLYGTSQLDAGIYAYNKDAGGNAYGTVLTDDWPIVNGQVLANTVNFTSNVTVNSIHGMFQTSSVNYYGFDTAWFELNPR